MRIVGLDISMTGTGTAVWSAGEWLGTYKFGRNGHNDETLRQRRSRITTLADQVHAVAEPHDIDLVMVEQPAYSRGGAGTWDRAGVWWAILGPYVDYRCHIIEVAPNTIKKFATDDGRASKTQMIAAMLKRHPDAGVMDDNTADAVALVDIALARYRAPDSTFWPLYAKTIADRVFEVAA